MRVTYRLPLNEGTRVPARVPNLRKAMCRNNLQRPKWRRRESNPQTIRCNELNDKDLQKQGRAQSVNEQCFGDSSGQELAEPDTSLIRINEGWARR